MSNLFAYGTLMCADIMKSVAGVLPESRKGRIQNFRRLQIKNEHYPGLIRKDGSSVDGELYCDVPEKCWERLDSFEGDMYSRIEIVVTLPGDVEMVAFTYLVKDEFTHLLHHKDWDFERFLEKGKGQFVEDYSGYDKID